jgi:hypothetical protein
MLFGSKEAFMFAYPRRLALGIASLAALLLGIGLVALSATPAAATTCPSLTYAPQGVTIGDCSEIFGITNSGSTFVVSPNYVNTTPYDSSGDVLVGVTNCATCQTVYDLQLSNFTSSPIFNFSAHGGELLNNTSLAGLILSGCTTATGDQGTILNSGGTPIAGQCVIFNTLSVSNGEVIFGSGLPAGDTAIFALTATGQYGCVTNQSGNTVPTSGLTCTTTTVSEPAAIGIFLAGLMGFGILRHRWLARAASPRRPRPKRQSRQIRHLEWISRLWATA